MRCLLSGERMTLEGEIYIYARFEAKSLESKHRQCIQSKKGVCLRAAWVAAAKETGQKPEQAAGKAKDDGKEFILFWIFQTMNSRKSSKCYHKTCNANVPKNRHACWPHSFKNNIPKILFMFLRYTSCPKKHYNGCSHTRWVSMNSNHNTLKKISLTKSQDNLRQVPICSNLFLENEN